MMVERIENPYESHDVIRIHRSERMTPYPSGFMKEFASYLSENDFKYYPNTDTLKDKLAKHHNIDSNNIILGDGADRIIKQVFEAFVPGGMSDVVSTEMCFPMYKVYTDLMGARFNEIPFTFNRGTYDTAVHVKRPVVEIDDIIAGLHEHTDLCVLTNPNSPIGYCYTFGEISKLAEATKDRRIPLLIDEAYIEFECEEHSAIDLIDEYKHIIVVRTFSKAWGAAGIRVGYGMAHPDMISTLSKWRRMYEISGISQKFAEFLLSDFGKKENAEYLYKTNNTKHWLMTELRNKKYEVIPSKTNWIHINNLLDGDTFDWILKSRDVLFKTCPFPGERDRYNWLRMSFSAGLENNKEFLDILEKF